MLTSINMYFYRNLNYPLYLVNKALANRSVGFPGSFIETQISPDNKQALGSLVFSSWSFLEPSLYSTLVSCTISCQRADILYSRYNTVTLSLEPTHFKLLFLYLPHISVKLIWKTPFLIFGLQYFSVTLFSEAGIRHRTNSTLDINTLWSKTQVFNMDNLQFKQVLHTQGL